MKTVATKLNKKDLEDFAKECEKDGTTVCEKLRTLVQASLGNEFEKVTAEDNSKFQTEEKPQNLPQIKKLIEQIDIAISYKEKRIQSISEKIKQSGQGKIESLLTNCFNLMLMELNYDLELLNDLKNDISKRKNLQN